VAETLEQASKRVEEVGGANADFVVPDFHGEHNNQKAVEVEKQHLENV
jgi:hypothetical protein